MLFMEKIRNYVNELFEDAPKTRKVKELKEEIIINLEEKFADLLSEGKKESEAYREVVSSIGNIDELLGDMSGEQEVVKYENPAQKKRTALVVSIAVAMYILSIVVICVTEELGLPDFVGLSGFLTIAGFATCLLIYHFMSQPKYKKVDDTMVEEFKEWKSQKNKNNVVRNSVHSIIWMLVTIAYFLISFIFHIWSISWIVFLIGIVVQQIVDLIMFGGEK